LARGLQKNCRGARHVSATDDGHSRKTAHRARPLQTMTQMRIHRRGFIAICGGGAIGLLSGDLLVTPARASSSSIVTPSAIGPVNAYRKANGRSALQADAALGKAAREHSIAMATAGRLDHSRFRARLRQFAITGAAAENVALGQADVAAVLAAWQNSRGHRRNLLGRYSRLGVAVARNPVSANRPFWTMILAA
jgi:hypothetical protein